MGQNMQVVEAMMAAWKKRDVEGFIATLADDIEYHWHPTKRPAVGKDKMRKFLSNYEAGFDQQEWRVTHSAENGEVLFVEGMEVLVDRSTGVKMDNPFVQVFEVRDGLIRRMRDYYDTSQVHAPAKPDTRAASA
ncbi:MAG: nuclear transport factor 2 family protein [Alphaproteobacteria bacterium]|nr:nuclear transport factor 2 family protein [Alphaproteobacteria bacterium]MBU2378684.1 nuclear transport factor 2 family protein [Alphaproteobacteria bacterium]